MSEMRMKLDLCALPTLQGGLLKASALLQAPVVAVLVADGEVPTISIEEGGVVVELEFSNLRALRRFRRQVASLVLPREDRDLG